MTPVTIATLISVAGFLVSVIVSSFIAGVGWGTVRRDVDGLRREVAEIKGMFVLKLRDDADKR